MGTFAIDASSTTAGPVRVAGLTRKEAIAQLEHFKQLGVTAILIWDGDRSLTEAELRSMQDRNA